MPERNGLKFVVATILLFSLPYLLLSMHFIYGSRALRGKDTLRLFEMRTTAGAQIVSGEMNARWNLARLAGDGKFSSAGAEGRRAFLGARLKEAPSVFYELAAFSAAGKEQVRVSAARDGKPPADYAGSSVLAEARATGRPAGAVEFGDYTPPALVLAVPAGAGGSRGYLAGRLSLAGICELVRQLGRNSHGSFGLMDAGGQVIADSAGLASAKPGAAAPGASAALAEAARKLGVPSMSREATFKGSAVLVSVSAVPGTAWWIYETMDAAQVSAFGAGNTGQVLLSGLVLLVLAGLVSNSLARRWLPGRD